MAAGSENRVHTIPTHNRRVADRLREASALLHAQGASPYRANAYRQAAESIARMPRDVLDIYAAEGVKGLDAIPHVGLGIAAAVAEMLTSGRWAQLDRLRGSIDVDREYREKAGRGELKTIAPRRFNPEGQAWLPVLHARRGRWHFTVLYSNTALAHQLGRTRDWVVVYFYGGDHVERQHTIVTEPRGELADRRVVRSREAECLDYYHPMLSAA